MGQITYCTTARFQAAQANLKVVLIASLASYGYPTDPTTNTPDLPSYTPRGVVPFAPRDPVPAAIVGADNRTPLLALWCLIRDTNGYTSSDSIQFDLFRALAMFGATEDAMELVLACTQGLWAWIEVYGEPVEDGERFARACIGTGTLELIAALD